MLIRKATLADGKRCLEIYNGVCDWEAQNTILTAWDKEFYPTMETVSSALSRDDLFVLEDSDKTTGKNQIVACGIINQEQPDFYQKYNWTIPATVQEALVLHTFAVDTNYQGAGYGRFFMNFYEDLARKKGCKVLRLDTTLTNLPAQSFYKKLGFRITGQFECDPNGIGTNIVLLGLEKPSVV
ncbi:MAG: GNAT family N-acetyltransferase [Treponema sp.]|nr:GNAT family N-acetyltransferase [Treponema sp.]